VGAIIVEFLRIHVYSSKRDSSERLLAPSSLIASLLPMGIFKSRWNDETYLMTAFQMIAAAIDVSAHTQIAKVLNVEVADLWAPYFWTIAPL